VIGQYLISLYLTQTAPGSTYGAAGSLVLVLMWVYYSSLILFMGTALTRAFIEQRGDRVVPKPPPYACTWTSWRTTAPG
jgi:membrane protein